MRNTSRVLFVAAVASIGYTASLVQAQTYTETASGGFGTSTLPAGAQEFFRDSFGSMPYYWDQRGRTIANADNTSTLVPIPLTTIAPKLWSASDADLFKIQITDGAAFTAQITNTTNILSLYAADGTAVAASRGGGAANALVGSTLGLTPGMYFIGESQASGVPGDAGFGVPRNNANLALFDFSTNGVKTPITQADMKLSTDPVIAFTTHGNSNGSGGFFLIGPSTFTSPQPNITLTGAQAALTPEPGTAAVLAGLCAMAIRRRR